MYVNQYDQLTTDMWTVQHIKTYMYMISFKK